MIIFSTHPSLTKYLFGLYNCIEIDSNEFWLKQDLSIKCWEQSHIKWSIGIGLPAIILWIVGAPLICLYILKQK